MHHHGHDGKHGHGWMMILCLLPMLALLLLPRLSLGAGSLGALLPLGLLLISPLVHIGMMFMMRDDGPKKTEEERPALKE